MTRVLVRIYDEDTDETIVEEDSALFENEEEIANQAFRVQSNYYNRLDAESPDWGEL